MFFSRNECYGFGIAIAGTPVYMVMKRRIRVMKVTSFMIVFIIFWVEMFR